MGPECGPKHFFSAANREQTTPVGSARCFRIVSAPSTSPRRKFQDDRRLTVTAWMFVARSAQKRRLVSVVLDSSARYGLGAGPTLARPSPECPLKQKRGFPGTAFDQKTYPAHTPTDAHPERSWSPSDQIEQAATFSKILTLPGRPETPNSGRAPSQCDILRGVHQSRPLCDGGLTLRRTCRKAKVSDRGTLTTLWPGCGAILGGPTGMFPGDGLLGCSIVWEALAGLYSGSRPLEILPWHLNRWFSDALVRVGRVSCLSCLSEGNLRGLSRASNCRVKGDVCELIKRAVFACRGL